MFKYSVILIVLIFIGKTAFAENYMIYSISQDFPMGFENEVLKKNFYVNIGEEQGVRSGTELNVYRTISRNNPFAKEKMERVNFQVKVGELKVIHTQGGNAIAEFNNFKTINPNLFLEVNSLMIGDHVSVKVD